jgi:hypothetical protein
MLATYLYKDTILHLLENDGSATYLEVGSFDGEGIAFLCKRFPERIFYAIDPFIEDGHTEALTHVSKGIPITAIREQFLFNTKDCKNLVHFEMTSQEFIDKHLYQDLDIKVYLIDGDHSYEGATVDFKLAELLHTSHPLHIIVDDTHKPSVVAAIKDFAETHQNAEVAYLQSPAAHVILKGAKNATRA